MTEYYVVAMNHIDMAFVMREEAQEELIEILLERVINVLERHPELHFALEQAAHYRKLEERRPDLFSKVKELLKDGRMEFLGGMATTAETNFPDGECFVRNLGMGHRWVDEHLGVKPAVGWLVDTFGLHAQVPQIMKQFGFIHVHANRFGGNKRYDLFWDEGLDGSKVLIIGRDLASINVLPDTQSFYLCRNWGDIEKIYQDADALTSSLPKLVNYYTENEEVFSEYYLKLTDKRNEAGNWKHSTYAEYSKALETHGYNVPVLHGDLNPEFTGTFALRTMLRVENRKAETMLLDAEKWEALFGISNKDGKKSMEDSWWDIFICQFHDVFSGSHEDITFESILNKFHKIQQVSEAVQRDALKLQEDSNSVLACNSLPWKRKEWVTVENAEGLSNCVLIEAAAGGIRQYDTETLHSCGPNSPLTGKEIQNEYLHLVLDERDGIKCLEDLNGNCFMKDAADFLLAEEDRGGLQIELCEGNEIFALSGSVSIENAFENEMEQQITMTGTFPYMNWNKGNNKLSWDARFSLRRGEKALRLKLTVDWKGEATRIRLRIPGCMEGRDVFYEIPYGVVRREAYRNRPTARGEWPAHRFTAIENGTKGIALINKGVAGVEQEGNVLTTTLIRAYGDSEGIWIKPTAVSSQYGKQTFEFMIAPYMGDYHDAGIVQLAQEFNQPLRAWSGKSELDLTEESWYALDQKNLVLSAIKNAWDESGDLIVRIFESEGRATESKVFLKGMQDVYSSDMTEMKGEPLMHNGDFLTLQFAPFEIKTIRVQRQRA